ncbi:hypothetical protein H1P_270007 [Hyella patelloides LEGE 07179]|uniref:SnoaL-like domain-containing protein n=1 Tax=Hyella patelloides LEGE 07179 TaxID=945734 RepID=A0A563VT05_9CYAN|nr:nuclear transport factor 2 family protein [Hyella patelloides]VEP14514.1 hypothetical protein H1P_270007 [Hyella patelloides LEGE 07179]
MPNVKQSNRSLLTLKTATQVNLNNKEIKQIRDRLAQWQQLFAPGDNLYTLDGYENLFWQNHHELLIYDNYAEKDTRWTGFNRYREIWEHEINKNFPGFTMYRIEVDRIEANGDIAWSACTWWGSVIKAGKTLYTAQHATHIWKKNQGQWQIVHEHLTSGIKENGQESHRSQEDIDLDDQTLHHQRA